MDPNLELPTLICPVCSDVIDGDDDMLNGYVMDEVPCGRCRAQGYDAETMELVPRTRNPLT